MSEPKSPPVAVCEVCGDMSDRIETINRQCSRSYGKKRCRGIYGSRLSNDDWLACVRCDGTGNNKSGGCLHCQGNGWLKNRS